MRDSSTCFRVWSDNERFFQTPEDSFGFKLYGIKKVTVFVIGIFHPQGSTVVYRVLFILNGAPSAHDALAETLLRMWSNRS
jgi:hypothetical protein